MAVYELKYPQHIPHIRSMYSDGMSVRRIAEATHMPYSTVIQYIHRLLDSGKLEMRPKVCPDLKKHKAEWDRVRECPELWWTIDPAVTGEQKEMFAEVEDTAAWWQEHEQEWRAACEAAHRVLVQMAQAQEVAGC